MTTEVEVVNRGPLDVEVEGHRIRPNESKSFHLWGDKPLTIAEIDEAKKEAARESAEIIGGLPAPLKLQPDAPLTVGEVFEGAKQALEEANVKEEANEA